MLLKKTFFNDSSFEKVSVDLGAVCRTVTEGPNRGSCFRGIGEALIRASGYDPLRMAEGCDSAAADLKDSVMCRAGAAYYHRVLYHDKANQERALESCNGLSENLKEVCRSYGRSDLSEQALFNLI